ncbi:PAS domain S-box protein [Caldimonas tepidiphila]|uniref:PAS domain S-box protein n=1 Tax=Caldimonas tepidiphila TaxID=2315841 RepID=UPI000E5BB827|nr:bifunctional diguanylate cyclase/phosphodiesterase [Caldimonas tepidiphila]
MKPMEKWVGDGSGTAGTEAAMRRLADRVRLLVWTTDENLVCIQLNREARAYLDRAEQFSTQVWRRFMHPEDRPQVVDFVTRARNAREDYEVEYRIVRSDGTIRWMKSIGAACVDAAGRYIGYTGTICDVTHWYELQDQLARSEAEHRLIAESASDLIAHYDVHGHHVYVSPSCRQLLGYEGVEMLGRNAYEMIHPADVPTVLAEVSAQVRTRRAPAPLELRVQRRDGSHVWVSTLTRVLFDPHGGEMVGAIAISRDITEARAIRQQLLEREERYRRLTRLSSDWYWETDAEGHFTLVSDGAAGWLGGSAEVLLGRTRQEIAADPQDPGLRAYLDSFSRREPFRDIVYVAHPHRDLGVRHVSIIGEPMWRDGVFAGYRGLSRNVTEQREIEQRLQALNDENRKLVDNSLDLICTVDGEGRLLRVNPAGCRMTGFEPQELLGRRWHELVHPEDLQQALAAWRGQLADGPGELRDFENRWLRKDGTTIHLSWSAKWVPQQGMLYATARDVTEQRRAKQALQQANERLETVLESIDDAFFSFDRELRVTYFNSAAHPWTDIPPERLLGRHLFDEVEPGLRGTVFEREFLEVATMRQSVQFEAFYAPRGVWLWVRAYPSGDGGLSVFFHDITERKAAEIALARSEARFARLIDSTTEGYFVAAADLSFAEVNPALCRMTGYAQAELVGQPLSVLFSDCPLGGAFLPGDRSGRNTFELDDVALRHRDGSEVSVLMNAHIERDAQGAPLTLTAFLNDITERKRTERRLEQLATHDLLTDLPNRSLLNERTDAMIGAAALRGESLAVLFIDLDHFKEVNDSMGHEAGDRLLKDVAQRLREHLRPGDLVARLGGDEFVVVLPSSQGAKSAVAVAEKLLERLASPLELGAQEVFVGASIGISLYPRDGCTKEALFQNADAAMYRAKAAGRNGYRFYTPQMQEEARTRLTLESALRRALEREEFEVHYQPRLDVATLEVVGSEALLRWRHPQLGNVPPAQFIPLAEETGLIGPIGTWVLQQACRQNQQWVRDFGRPLSVSVNLSPRQLHDRGLVAKVDEALRSAGMAAALLELELTESSLMQDPDSAAGTLGRLRALGLRLAVDDFGTGHSSLAYLRRFPLDVLKLDRSFLSQPAEEVSVGPLAQAIIHLAHTLKLRVVAEGVETAEVFGFLAEAGCDEAQGYHLCRPVPPAEFERFLRQRGAGSAG